jgi:hypothetical protein
MMAQPMNRNRPASLFLLSRKSIAQLLLGCFFVVTVIAPAAPINKLLFVALSLWLLADMLFARSPEVILVAPPVIIFAIFLYGFALSLFNRSDFPMALQFLLSVLILFQILFIRRYRIDVEKLIMVSSNSMVVATILLWCATFVPGMPMASLILDFMRTYSLSAFSEREFFEEATLSLHLGTAPILFVGFAVFAKRFCQARRVADFLLMVATALAIVLSASRGIIAGSGLILMIFVFMYAPRRIRFGIAVALLALVVFGLYQALTGTELLSASEGSNAGKLGHMKSFLEQLTAASLLFGRGLAHVFYSVGSESFKADTEITPMDMVRFFGIILSLLLYVMIVLPVRRLSSYTGENTADVLIFMIYLLLSFTNPIMFNSMGMLVVLWYWSKIYAALDAGRAALPVEAVVR